MRLLPCLLLLLSFSASAEILRVEHEGFTLWVSCEFKAPVMYRYYAQRDTGSFSRENQFYTDDKVPKRCQQTSTRSYSKKYSQGRAYDRGHQVPANHFDFSRKAIHETNMMTNVLPQAAKMNRGAMYRTEEITECYRDISDLTVMGGPIWMGDESNDYFLKSHGVKTPEAYWKVILRQDRVIAWIIPNIESATQATLDNHLSTVDKIESLTGLTLPVPQQLKGVKVNSSWLVPKGCNKG